MIGLQRLGRLAPAAPAFSPWLLAMRPRTLGLSVVPVMTGTTIAWAETGRVHWPAAVAAGLAAMLIQVATNLHNDAADFERGGDGPGRLGPPRVTALGLGQRGWARGMAPKRGVPRALPPPRPTGRAASRCHWRG